MERVTITIHCVDGSGNRVAADTTVRVEKGVSQTITAPAIANYTATGTTSVTQTWTADSEVTFTYLLTPTGRPPHHRILDYQRSSHWLQWRHL